MSLDHATVRRIASLARIRVEDNRALVLMDCTDAFGRVDKVMTSTTPSAGFAQGASGWTTRSRCI